MGLNHGQHSLLEFDTRHSSQPAEGNLGDSGDTGDLGRQATRRDAASWMSFILGHTWRSHSSTDESWTDSPGLIFQMFSTVKK